MTQVQTRCSADADKPARRVQRSAKVTKHSIPFHMLGIVSSCAIVTYSLRRTILQKCHDIEIRVRGPLRSLEAVTFQ